MTLFLNLLSSAFSLQLGDGTSKNRWVPVKIMDHVQKVSGGLEHTLILLDDNSLWSVGGNTRGQLGDGSTRDRAVPQRIMEGVVDVSAGNNFSLALKADGTLWIFGAVPTAIEKAKNKFSVDRIIDTTITKPRMIDSDVSAMSAGFGYALFVKQDHSLWGFGSNDNGVLGDGTRTPRASPVRIRENVASVFSGQISSLIVDGDRNLFIAGQVYNGTTGPEAHTSLDYELVSKDVLGMTEGLFISIDQSLWGFGFAAYGNLGLGKTKDTVPPTRVTDGVAAVASSQSHTLILRISGELLSCGGGSNMFGALGNGTNKPQNIPVFVMSDVKAIAVGSYHSLAIKNDGSLWAFGLNSRPGLQ